MLRNDPEYATSTGHHEYDDRWTDWSKAARDQRRQFFEQRLAAMASAQTGDSAEELLTTRVVRFISELLALKPGTSIRICSASAK